MKRKYSWGNLILCGVSSKNADFAPRMVGGGEYRGVDVLPNPGVKIHTLVYTLTFLAQPPKKVLRIRVETHDPSDGNSIHYHIQDGKKN